MNTNKMITEKQMVVASKATGELYIYQFKYETRRLDGRLRTGPSIRLTSSGVASIYPYNFFVKYIDRKFELVGEF